MSGLHVVIRSRITFCLLQASRFLAFLPYVFRYRQDKTKVLNYVVFI